MGVVHRRRQEVYVHLVWSTWDHAPLIDENVQFWLWPMLAEEARGLGCHRVVVGGTADHIHLLCELPTTLTVAAVAQQTKGASSRAANARGVPLQWQGGYGAFSVSPTAWAVVEAYVRNQAAHHAGGTQDSNWE